MAASLSLFSSLSFPSLVSRNVRFVECMYNSRYNLVSFCLIHNESYKNGFNRLFRKITGRIIIAEFFCCLLLFWFLLGEYLRYFVRFYYSRV